MKNSRRNRKSFVKSLKNTGKNVLPVVDKGLKNVGTTAKYVVVKTAPVAEKAVANIYGTMAKGFNLGLEGANNVYNNVTRMSRKRRGKKYSKKSRRKH